MFFVKGVAFKKWQMDNSLCSSVQIKECVIYADLNYMWADHKKTSEKIEIKKVFKKSSIFKLQI